MERRDFLTASFGNDFPKYEHREYEKLFEITQTEIDSGLERYNGEWSTPQIYHLLRRTMFGVKKDQLLNSQEKSMDELVSELMADSELPDPPININPDDPVAIGEPWVDDYSDVVFGVNQKRIASIRFWWSLMMLNQGVSIREKMTLFWHNHFATETIVYKVPHFAYWQNQLEREYALGNFQELVEKITIDPGMLKYLNGNENTNRAPNENYGRELFELFTIGKGALIEEGNYTNYTESDIQEASKVLTGWNYTLRGGKFEVQFRVGAHTGGVKNFSSSFNNATIEANGENEYKDLIQMIFAQDETAKFICRKLYHWFVNNRIDSKVEKNMIEPMANIFRSNNYEVKPVLEALLKSQHFYDINIVGSLIKNPVDFLYTIYKQFNLKIFENANNSLEDTIIAYNVIRTIGIDFGYLLQMQILDPPNVAGWAAYYQEPAFNRLWLNSVTMPYRFQIGVGFVNKLIKIRNGGKVLLILPEILEHIETYTDPSNPVLLVNEIAEFLFPIELTKIQLDYLKSAIVNVGEGDYIWTGIWNGYKADPDNENLKNVAENRLTILFIIALSLAEYQLS